MHPRQVAGGRRQPIATGFRWKFPLLGIGMEIKPTGSLSRLTANTALSETTAFQIIWK